MVRIQSLSQAQTTAAVWQLALAASLLLQPEDISVLFRQTRYTTIRLPTIGIVQLAFITICFYAHQTALRPGADLKRLRFLQRVVGILHIQRADRAGPRLRI